ncbi:hypothetical protein HK104_003515 [Borealophlyctis nickersoniae]|nr:hypothetical protein HK104_003515 [Borealophlyctis nickersoniae]
MVATTTTLFVMTKDYPDIQREITSTQLPKFLTVTLNIMEKTEDQTPSVFHNLSKLFLTFPGATRSASDRAVKASFTCLNRMPARPEIIEAVSTCLLAIHSNEDKAGSRGSQADFVDKFCGSMHAVLDRIFSCVEEGEPL